MHNGKNLKDKHMNKSIDALKPVLTLALEALEEVQQHQNTSNWFNERVNAVREVLAEQQEPDYSICPSCGGMASDPIVPPLAQYQDIADLKPVLTLALKALENWWEFDPENWGDADKKALAAIHEALADQCVCGEPDTPGTHRTDGPCLAEQPAPATELREQQEPVAWMTHSNDLLLFHRTRAEALNWQTQPTPLYTSPPASKPLTEEQARKALSTVLWSDMMGMVRAIEAAHGIKGDA